MFSMKRFFFCAFLCLCASNVKGRPVPDVVRPSDAENDHFNGQLVDDPLRIEIGKVTRPALDIMSSKKLLQASNIEVTTEQIYHQEPTVPTTDASSASPIPAGQQSSDSVSGSGPSPIPSPDLVTSNPNVPVTNSNSGVTITVPPTAMPVSIIVPATVEPMPVPIPTTATAVPTEAPASGVSVTLPIPTTAVPLHKNLPTTAESVIVTTTNDMLATKILPSPIPAKPKPKAKKPRRKGKSKPKAKRPTTTSTTTTQDPNIANIPWPPPDEDDLAYTDRDYSNWGLWGPPPDDPFWIRPRLTDPPRHQHPDSQFKWKDPSPLLSDEEEAKVQAYWANDAIRHGRPTPRPHTHQPMVITKVNPFEPTLPIPKKTNIPNPSTTTQKPKPKPKVAKTTTPVPVLLEPYSAITFLVGTLIVLPLGTIIVRTMKLLRISLVLVCLTHIVFISTVIGLTISALIREYRSKAPDQPKPATKALSSLIGVAWMTSIITIFVTGILGQCYFFKQGGFALFDFGHRLSGRCGVGLALIMEYRSELTRTTSLNGRPMFSFALNSMDIVILGFLFFIVTESIDFLASIGWGKYLCRRDYARVAPFPYHDSSPSPTRHRKRTRKTAPPNQDVQNRQSRFIEPSPEGPVTLKPAPPKLLTSCDESGRFQGSNPSRPESAGGDTFQHSQTHVKDPNALPFKIVIDKKTAPNQDPDGLNTLKSAPSKVLTSCDQYGNSQQLNPSRPGSAGAVTLHDHRQVKAPDGLPFEVVIDKKKPPDRNQRFQQFNPSRPGSADAFTNYDHRPVLEPDGWSFEVPIDEKKPPDRNQWFQQFNPSRPWSADAVTFHDHGQVKEPDGLPFEVIDKKKPPDRNQRFQQINPSRPWSADGFTNYDHRQVQEPDGLPFEVIDKKKPPDRNQRFQQINPSRPWSADGFTNYDHRQVQEPDGLPFEVIDKKKPPDRNQNRNPNSDDMLFEVVIHKRPE